MSLRIPIDALQRLTDASRAVVTALPTTPRARSPRGRERAAVRSGPHGHARAELLDRLHQDLVIRCQHHALLVLGVCDVLVAAEQREDESIITPLLATATRSLAEAAGETSWLLGYDLTALERPIELGRRWLIWAWRNLDNLRDQLAGGAPDDVDETDARLETLSTGAGFTVSRAKPDGTPLFPMVLTAAGSRGAVPKNNKLVDDLHDCPGTYADLSRAAHNDHNGIAASVTLLGPVVDGRATVGVAGVFYPLPTALVTVGLALHKTSRALAVWNGVEVRALDRALAGALTVSRGANLVPPWPADDTESDAQT